VVWCQAGKKGKKRDANENGTPLMTSGIHDLIDGMRPRLMDFSFPGAEPGYCERSSMPHDQCTSEVEGRQEQRETPFSAAPNHHEIIGCKAHRIEPECWKGLRRRLEGELDRADPQRHVSHSRQSASESRSAI
jgi:hypothetical protein